jgi:MFS family permease
VWARRDIRLALLGRVVSMFGDQALWLANGIWVRELTGSNAAAGLVFFFFGLPTLCSPLSGLLVDRVRRRPLLVSTEACLGAFVLCLLFVHGPGQVWLIYAVTFVYGCAGTITASARSALFRTLIEDDDQLASVNGLMQTAQQGLQLVAPVTGAALFAWLGGPAVAMIDTATFAVVVAAFGLLRVHEPRPEGHRSHWRVEVSAGIRHVWQTTALRQMTVAVGVSLLVVGFFETLIFSVATVGLHRGASFVGVLASAQGVGAIVGGLSAVRVMRVIGESRTVACGLLLVGLGACGLMAPDVGIVLPAAAVAGTGVPWLIVALFTALQRWTPTRLQGRAFSAVDVLISTPQTASIGLGALLVAVVDYRLLVAVVAVVVLASGLWLITRRPATSTAELAGAVS